MAVVKIVAVAAVTATVIFSSQVFVLAHGQRFGCCRHGQNIQERRFFCSGSALIIFLIRPGRSRHSVFLMSRRDTLTAGTDSVLFLIVWAFHGNSLLFYIFIILNGTKKQRQYHAADLPRDKTTAAFMVFVFI